MKTMEEDELCFPQLLNASCKKPTQPHNEAMLIYILLSSVSLLTVFLNLLVIISIFHFRQLHTPTNLLLLSLATSDFLVGFLLMPVEIIYIESCWFLGDLLCSLYYVLDYMISSTSVTNMVLISVDRYVAICHPLAYNSKITKNRVKLCVCFCWVCSAIYSSLLLNDHLGQPGRSNSCFGECVVVINSTAGVVDLVLTFIIPISVIIILYSRVFVVALSQARAIRAHISAITHRSVATVKAKKSERKAATTLGIVIVVFLICFCPYYYHILLGQETSIDASSAAFEIWFAHFSSCVNPIIYAFFYPWFRKSIKLIVAFKTLQPHSRDASILH